MLYTIIIKFLLEVTQRNCEKMERLLKPIDLAKFFGVTKACVFLWVEKRILPAIKINKTVRFRRQDLEWFIKKRYMGDRPLPTEVMDFVRKGCGDYFRKAIVNY